MLKLQPWRLGIHTGIACLAGLFGLQTLSVYVRMYTFFLLVVWLHTVQTPQTAATEAA
jgi:hypothetical protein